MSKKWFLFFLASYVLAGINIETSYADKVCLRIHKSGTKLVRRVVTSGNCPRKFIELIDTSVLVGPQGPIGETGNQGPAGSQGPTGDQGADGVLRVWGDGSAGALTVSSSGALANQNLQFTDFTVNEGVVLSVLSGATIRATGECLVSGTINVSTGAGGGVFESASDSSTYPGVRPPHPGLSFRAAGHGELGSNAALRAGGGPGLSIFSHELRAINSIQGSTFGGGGGGAGIGFGGAGGGAIALFCKNGVSVTATGIINAAGGNASNGTGAGGGAGGLILLASSNSVKNFGDIRAPGGNGGSSFSRIGPGGGGGGGVIRIISPSVIRDGTESLSGGNAGTISGPVSGDLRFGGGAVVVLVEPVGLEEV